MRNAEGEQAMSSISTKDEKAEQFMELYPKLSESSKAKVIEMIEALKCGDDSKVMELMEEVKGGNNEQD
jgi:predicted HAD superfamily phosphohydrolase